MECKTSGIAGQGSRSQVTCNIFKSDEKVLKYWVPSSDIFDIVLDPMLVANSRLRRCVKSRIVQSPPTHPQVVAYQSCEACPACVILPAVDGGGAGVKRPMFSRRLSCFSGWLHARAGHSRRRRWRHRRRTDNPPPPDQLIRSVGGPVGRTRAVLLPALPH